MQKRVARRMRKGEDVPPLQGGEGFGDSVPGASPRALTWRASSPDRGGVKGAEGLCGSKVGFADLPHLCPLPKERSIYRRFTGGLDDCGADPAAGFLQQRPAFLPDESGGAGYRAPACLNNFRLSQPGQPPANIRHLPPEQHLSRCFPTRHFALPGNVTFFESGI